MSPSEYQKLAERTECDQTRSLARLACLTMSRTRDYGPAQLKAVRLNHGVLGLAGEVGELAAALEKWIYYGRPLDQGNIAEEVGDCLWYLAQICNSLGLDLGACMEANIRKLRARYPERYTDEAAANRNAEAERRALGVGEIGGEIAPEETGPCAPGPLEFPATGNRGALEAQRRLQESCGHDWNEPERQQTRCRACGAHRHLSSGFKPCAGRPPAIEPPPGRAEERDSADQWVQNGHGWAEPPLEQDSE